MTPNATGVAAPSGSAGQCARAGRGSARKCFWGNAAANPADPPLAPSARQPDANRGSRSSRRAAARAVGARERPDEMRGGCIRATCARRRAATVPAGGADGGLAPEWTRSRDGVVPGASSRSLARGHAQSRHRFCGTTFSPRAPRDISQMLRQYSQGTAGMPTSGPPGKELVWAADRTAVRLSSPHEAVLQCRTLPRGAARQCFRQ